MKTYKKLTQLLCARNNSVKSGNQQWIENHGLSIENIMYHASPSGSGFDNGTQLDYTKSDSEKLVFESAFHPMNENGYYVSWIHFTITVRADLQFDFKLTLKGNFGKRQDLKEYILDEFYNFLDSEVKE